MAKVSGGVFTSFVLRDRPRSGTDRHAISSFAETCRCSPTSAPLGASLLAALCALSLGVSAQTPATDKLVDAQELLGRFKDANSRVPVIVLLHGDGPVLREADWDNAAKLGKLHTANHRAQEAVLQVLQPNEYKLRHRFDNIAGFSCELNWAALEKLQRHPQVRLIEPVQEHQAHGAQGIPLINGMNARALFDGTGISIAVVDTGVDTLHPRLGGAPFPNTKVIGGYDFGNNDGQPTPQGRAHGTACAGIVAGDLGTVGNYIGGGAVADHQSRGGPHGQSGRHPVHGQRTPTASAVTAARSRAIAAAPCPASPPSPSRPPEPT